MRADPAFIARLARHRTFLERRQRLGFKDAGPLLRALAITEAKAMNGEVVSKAPPVAVAPEITESDIRRACFELHLKSFRKGGFLEAKSA